MTARNMRMLGKVFIILSMVLLASCGTNETESASSGGVAAHLSWAPAELTTAKALASAPVGVSTVRIIISAADIISLQKDFSAASGSGTIDGILAGSGRRLIAQGLDGTGAVIYQGEAANLTVVAGQTTNAGTITMAAVAKPVLSGLSPTSGAPGTVVTISGANFSATAANNIVKFNGTPAVVTAATATTLTVTVPSGATTGTASVTTPAGTTTTAGTFTVTAQAAAPVGIQMGGARQGRVLDLTTAVTTLAGTGVLDGGPFWLPLSITTDGTNVYVADANKSNISKIRIASGAVTTLAGSGVSGTLDGTGTAASFSGINGITTDGSNLYVMCDLTIRKIVIATGTVTTLAGGVSGTMDGVGTTARFSYGHSITTDGTNLYVNDNDSIRQVVIASGAVTTLWKNAAVPKLSYRPILGGITTDGTNIFALDSLNRKILKIVIATKAVTIVGATVFDDNSDLTTDGTYLYFGDANSDGTQVVRKMAIATGAVSMAAGGTPLTLGVPKDGTIAAASFGGIMGLTTDGTNLYVSGFAKIRKIQ